MKCKYLLPCGRCDKFDKKCNSCNNDKLEPIMNPPQFYDKPNVKPLPILSEKHYLIFNKIS